VRGPGDVLAELQALPRTRHCPARATAHGRLLDDRIFSLTAGCVFLMWLGEQIDEYGLGNGRVADHPVGHCRPHGPARS
jgi:hypothetical protein